MTKVTELAAPGVSPQATPNPGTTVWVPMWNLAGGSSNAYKGDWAAGTYYPGDHVVYNGILYECVRQTSAAPVPWPPAPGAASYGTTLPASPVDGQEAVLVDSVTNPTYQWRFRYNAGSTSAYKWEFVGGAPLAVDDASSRTMPTLGAWTAFTSPILTLPRAGDYSFNFSAMLTATSASSCNLAIESDDSVRVAGFQTAAGDFAVARSNYRRNVPSAPYNHRIFYYTGSSGMSASRLMMSAVPIRVS